MIPSECFESLPNPLSVGSEGRSANLETWLSGKRDEILELFRYHVYGRTPKISSKDIAFLLLESDDSAMNGLAIRKQIRITIKASRGIHSFMLLLFIPKHQKKPCPCFLLMDHRNPLEHYTVELNRLAPNDFWPAEFIVEQGFCAARLIMQEVDMDKDDGFKGGIHAILDEDERQGDSWGTIAAWAWAGSRVMDYLVTDGDIDATRVAVVGHSRGGKTALWCGAQDERFALVVSNESGCTGAKLARTKTGERVKDINQVFPHWFCGNYRAFEDREENMPVDQHELLALIAPRPLYVASAEIDPEVAPDEEFFALKYSEPVYSLFGRKGFKENNVPAIDSPIRSLDGYLGYHVRHGRHALERFDWEQYLDFAKSHFIK